MICTLECARYNSRITNTGDVKILKTMEVNKNIWKGLQLPFVISLCALASAIIITGCNGGSNDERDELLIQNVSIVSAERDAPSEPLDVLIRDDRIVEIGQALSVAGLKEDNIIDGTDLFLSPGLIDSHTHLSGYWSMTSEQQEANPEVYSAFREQFPRSFLYYGVTTVIDLSSNAERISAWNDRAIRPQAYFCGGAILVDSYPMNISLEPFPYEYFSNFLYDETQEDSDWPVGYDKAEHTPEVVVANIKSEGAICVKSAYERGFNPFAAAWPLPSLELLQALTAAAHENGLPLVLHATSLAGQQIGLQAGVDAFVHGLFTPDATSGLNAEAIQLLDEINQQGIGWQPTIQVLYGQRDLHDPSYLASSDLQNALPRSLIEWYATEDGQWYRDEMALNWKGVIDNFGWQAIQAEQIVNVTAATNYLADLHGSLLFGSDTPGNATFAMPPGLNGRLEMNNWQAAGVTALKTFQAATIDNAEFFGLQDEIGTVEVGKQADLLLLKFDPTKNIEAYDSIQMIILDGEVLNRADLSAVNIE
jgi:imidazolonepropionase-like amidohydrolase